MAISVQRVLLGLAVASLPACGDDQPPKISVPPTTTALPPGPGGGSSTPTEGGGSASDTAGGTDTGETGGPSGCAGPSPSIPPEDPSPTCLPGVPCVTDANCPAGHACNTALEPPACTLLYCGAAGTPCHDDSVCADGQQCFEGRCNPCTFCGDLCAVDFSSDPAHCGCCDHPVPAGGVCVDGVATCPLGQTECGGACVDLATDRQHCGACDKPVDAGVDCVDGEPGCVSPDGFSNVALCGGKCVDLDDDVNNCGSCGATCPSGSCFSDGFCRVSYGGEGVLPKSCRAICGGAGLECVDGLGLGTAGYEGWCEATWETVSDCDDVPPTESYNGDYCGLGCTCKYGGQHCYCPAKPG